MHKQHSFQLRCRAVLTIIVIIISCNNNFRYFVESVEFNGTWPRHVKLELPGDIILGALMMIHERENEPLICGDVMPQGGIQALEAMLFTLEWVNRNKIIPHTQLGALILDDCDKDTYGLQQAVHFIKGSIGSLDDEDESTISGDCFCERRTEQPHHDASTRQKHVTGVIAAASSVTSIQVANLLKLFKIPQVSYFSTSPELGNQERFSYFFRTIPSDEYQVSAMVEIVDHFKWTYVSVVYEESSYGKVAFSKLEEKLGERNVCIAVREKLPKDSDVAKQDKYVQIVRKLMEKRKARAVIVYGSDQEVRDLMKAVKTEHATGLFTWIGSDGWSSRALVYQPDLDDLEGLEREVMGTISVQPMAKPIRGFYDYFKQLSVPTHTINPWFYEYWEKEHNCRFHGKDHPATPFNAMHKTKCTGHEHRDHVFEQQLQFVSDAVLVFAYALRQLLTDLCPSLKRSCIRNQYASEMNGYVKERRIDGTKLKEYIQNVRFTGLAGTDFRFTGNGGPPRYNIIHFRNNPTTGRKEWTVVGNFTLDGLKLNMDSIQFYANATGDEHGKAAVPFSRCSTPCEPGNKTVAMSAGDKCCWVCIPCNKGFYQADISHCLKCPAGTKSSQNRTYCIQIPEERIALDSVYSLVCLVLALVGTSATVLILAVFVRHNDSPMVKASGRELSYVIIVGLFLCFLLTPLMLLRPSDLICGLQRFLCGFCFTIVYAAILTKTNRIARIFKSGKRSIRRPIFISPESQLVICTIIVSVQVFVLCAWMYTHPPEAIYIYPTEEDNQFVCREAVKYSYLITYIYPILLCIICTVYAFQTRKIPEAFNESKYIGAAVYTTCIIWLAFVPIYFVVKDNITVRITSVCISTSLTAIVCQVCLFVPKVYIVVFRPERNVRQAMLGPKTAMSNQSKLLTSITRAHDRSDSSLYNSDDGATEPLRCQSRNNDVGKMFTCGDEGIDAATQTSPPPRHSVDLLNRRARFFQEDVQL